MSKPVLTNSMEISILSFEGRVKLVHEEIQRRKAEAAPTNPAHFVTRLWVSWLKKNVLDAPASGVQPC